MKHMPPRPATKQAKKKPNWVCNWHFEKAARLTGAQHIAGVDEVGRGPLFGPVVAAAVILPQNARFRGLTDSKKLTEPEREAFDKQIRSVAITWAVAEVDAATIDEINILQASRLAMRLAVERLAQTPCHLLIDGNFRIEWHCPQTTIVQGDARSLSIAAASVLAKVHRDRLLHQFDEQFPGYGLAQNKGYPSPHHRKALLELGPTQLHRRSFRGVLQPELIQEELDFLENLDDQYIPVSEDYSSIFE